MCSLLFIELGNWQTCQKSHLEEIPHVTVENQSRGWKTWIEFYTLCQSKTDRQALPI